MKVSLVLTILAQTALALKCRARNSNELITGKKTRDTGTTRLYNGVWWPLPRNFNQRNPDGILGLVQQQSSAQPFGNTLAYNRVVIFGDSSSDTGRQFQATRGQKPSPSKYWRGRVSNGPMWPDYLEKHYGLIMSNFAYGGATVSNQAFSQGDNLPDFNDQVNSYLARPSPRPSETLAVVNFVGNDLRGNFGAERMTQDMTRNLQRIVNSGIRNIVVFQSTNYYYLTELRLKQAMINMVNNFGASHPNVNIRLFPAFDFVYKYFNTPPSTATGPWNLNGKKNCFDQEREMPCRNPQDFLNYDLYHMSTVPNYNMAIDLAQFINQNWSFRL